MKLALALTITLFCLPAFAGFQGINGTTNLGVFNKITCSTGLTCTKVLDAFSVVSSPTITGSPITLTAASSTAALFHLRANANASNGDDWELSSTTSQGGLSFLNNTSGSQVQKMLLTTGGNLSTTGSVAASGGVASYDTTAVKTQYFGWLPKVAVTEGTSTTPSATTLYLTQIEIPSNKTITGINILNAATVGTNKWIVALFDDTGAVVANSATAGVLTSGGSAYQQIAFTAPVAVKGPGTYWIGAYMNGTTDRFYSVPAFGAHAGLAGSVTGQTFGTVAAVTLPTTFTADKGPVAYTY